MSEDDNLIEAYRQAQDIHRMTASQVFHVPFEEVTSLQRRNAKAVNFGIVYGISSFGLSQDLSISTKEASNYIESYFETYPGVKQFLDRQVQQAKEQGKIRHIGVTAHKLGVAEECIESGLYETLQFPLSYLSSEKDLELVRMCQEKNMGFIAMKGLAGGLISNSRAAFSYMSQFDHVLPIWGIQRMTELDEWLSYMDNPPAMDDDIRRFIEAEKEELTGDFCRGCGYCLPCPAGIPINNCARMSLMVRRAPSAAWLNETWQENMKKIENCLECGQCSSRCPYELDTPNLLKKNYEDYKNILAGKTSIS